MGNDVLITKNVYKLMNTNIGMEDEVGWVCLLFWYIFTYTTDSVYGNEEGR